MGGLEGVIIGWLGVNIGRYGLEGHGRKKIINIGDGMKCVEYVNFITRKNYFENAKKKNDEALFADIILHLFIFR